MAKKIVKIVKQGFSQSIGTALGNFGSWNIGNTSVEMEVELDMETKEGKEEFKKISNGLFKLCLNMNKADLDAAALRYPELALTLQKKEQFVLNQLPASGEND